MGLTRLERWERAKDIGNDPPNEVREILLSREGVLDWSSTVSYTHLTLPTNREV